MAEALKAKDVALTPEQQARVDAQGRARKREQALAGKTFEGLNKAEKDRLLKLVAVRLGLLIDSDDT